MNDTAIKNFAIWARRELISDVRKRCMKYGILEKGSLPATADSIDGRVLTSVERQQRADLLRIAADGGYRELVERAAYTWFNRLLAIRFMELNDRLPSHVRVLSGADGALRPQALAEAMDLPLEALDSTQVAELIQRGDDEALFREIFLAQCDELATCMPAVFEKIGGSMELLLPDSLLREDGVVEKLVTSIPEEDWREGVEIVGWMYQYYVSERKDEVFASFKKGKKAERESIAPATQLFTPNWIVRYLTENSLGRLWMLNKPSSSLPDDMPYFVKPDEDAETEFKKISSPEEITVVDPACGSGHILVYAFELLSKMYIEEGYTGRDAARLILEKNLSGMEIDPRAGAMASFALTMKACELDSRFLRRGVSPRITVLSRVEFEPEELQYIENLRDRPELMDAAAHLDECGSLLTVSSEDLEAIARDLASLAGETTIFGGSAAGKLKRLQTELEPLSRRYDVVVANPPYMGSSNMNSWLSGWTKKRYKEVCKDLCTCFIKRGFILSDDRGYEALITSDTCMYISSFEKMRKEVIEQTSIVCFIDTRGTNAHPDVFDANAGWVLWNHPGANIKGSYFKLNHPIPEKGQRLLEALANPGCGWFYHADASKFEVIPGSPIAYWASGTALNAFSNSEPFSEFVTPKSGFSTGDNDKFIHFWWELNWQSFCIDCTSLPEANLKTEYWFPLNKGGGFRKWYGNNLFAVNWRGNAFEMKKCSGYRSGCERYYFHKGLTWGTISSSMLSVRYSPIGYMPNRKGAMAFSDIEANLYYGLGLLNSSTAMYYLRFLAPTLDFSEGPIGALPFIKADRNSVSAIVRETIEISRRDYDSFEDSWDFERHPLI